MISELPGTLGLPDKGGANRSGIAPAEREAHDELVAEAEDRVNGAFRFEARDLESAPRGELLADEEAGRRGIDRKLVGVHGPRAVSRYFFPPGHFGAPP